LAVRTRSRSTRSRNGLWSSLVMASTKGIGMSCEVSRCYQKSRKPSVSLLISLLKFSPSWRFPLAEHIVDLERKIKAPKYVEQQPLKDLRKLFPTTEEDVTNINILPNLPAFSCDLDESQKEALHRILARKLAIVQVCSQRYFTTPWAKQASRALLVQARLICRLSRYASCCRTWAHLTHPLWSQPIPITPSINYFAISQNSNLISSV